MTKMTLLGLAAIVAAGLFVTSSIAGDGAVIGACDVNTRGKAYQWARQNPGMSYVEACKKVSGI